MPPNRPGNYTEFVRTAILFLVLLPLSAFADGPDGVEDVFIDSVDGLRIHAALRTPKGEGPFPGLLVIHGGAGRAPASLVRSMVSPESGSPTIREIAKRTWVVLSTDFREEAAFGKEEDDVLAAFRWLQRHPKVDAGRICAWGGSHGGQLALRLSEHVGDELACVAAGSPWLADPEVYFYGDFSEPPLSNLTAEDKEAIRINRRRYLVEHRNGVPAEGFRELVRERSIVGNAGRIRCPVLLLTSKGDVTVPHATVQPLVDSLKARGAKVEIFTAKHAGHEYYHLPAGPEEVDAHERAKWKLLSFLKRHLDKRKK